MNKDIVLSTLIGFFIGLVITTIIITGPKLISMVKIPPVKLSIPWTKNPNNQENTPSATQNVRQYNGITISSPVSDSISQKETLVVSGTAPQGSIIIVGGLADEDIYEVKNDGKFIGKIKLQEGLNTITVTSSLKDEISSEKINVFYTAEEF